MVSIEIFCSRLIAVRRALILALALGPSGILIQCAPACLAFFALAKYSIDFVEAPVPIEPISQMLELNKKINTSLCVNEGLWKENEFVDIINSRCGDYLCCSHYYVGTIRKFLHLAYLSNYLGWMIHHLWINPLSYVIGYSKKNKILGKIALKNVQIDKAISISDFSF